MALTTPRMCSKLGRSDSQTNEMEITSGELVRVRWMEANRPQFIYTKANNLLFSL